jgi:hypothetical protein
MYLRHKPHINGQILPFLCLFVLLLQFDVEPITASLSILMLAVQVYSGYALYRCVFKIKSNTVAGFLSAGFVFGTSTSVISSLLFVNSSVAAFAWSFPAIGIAIFLKFKKEQVPSFGPLDPGTDHMLSLLSILFATIVFLAQDYLWSLWLMPIVVFALSGIYVLRISQSLIRVAFIIAVAAASIVCFIAPFKTRGVYWWYLADDFSYFESIQKSLANFGLFDKFGSLGENWFGYHVLTFAWTGQLDRFTIAPEWVVLTQVGPPVVAFFFAASILYFLQSFSTSNSKFVLFLLPIFPTFFFYSYTSPSFVFGHIFLIFFVTLIVTYRATRFNLLQQCVIVLLSVLVFYAKFSNMPIALIACLGLFIASSIRQRRVFLPTTAPLLGVGLAYVLITLLFSLTSETRGQPEFGRFLGFAIERFPPLETIGDRWLRYLVGLVVTSKYFIVPVLGLALIFYLRKTASFALLVTGSLVLGFTTVFSFYSSGWGAGYFVTAGLCILNAIALSALGTFARRDDWSQRLLFGFFAGLFAQPVIALVAERFNDMKPSTLFLFTLFDAIWPISIIFTFLFAFVAVYLGSLRLKGKITFLVMLLAFSVGSIASANLLSLNNPVRGTELLASQSDLAFGTQEEQEVGKWLKTNTDKQSLIASNHFCGESCEGADWWQERTCQSGVNFFLPIYSERRFLAQGTVLGTCPNPPAWLDQRMELSIAFADSPTEQNKNRLEAFGVDYFVIDRTATMHTQWHSYGEVMFTSDLFLVIDLRQ